MNDNLNKLLIKIKPNQAILLGNSADITYFTGFDQFLVPQVRESLTLITHQQTIVFHPFFTTFKKQPNLTYCHSCNPKMVVQELRRLQNQYQITEVLVDADSVFLNEYWELKQIEAVQLLPLEKNWLWQLRMIKNSRELYLMKKAFAITTKTLKKTLNNIKVGMTEKQVAQQLVNGFKLAGADGEAFPSIVAFGKHTALPHHQPSNKKLVNNTPVLIDCGAKYLHYNADMTRTIWFGDQPDVRFLQIEKITKQAYRQTFQLLFQVGQTNKLGKNSDLITAARLDQAARQVISDVGFGRYFTHTTGHGLGLDIHEPPSLNGQNPTILQPNMVITIEPGIYLPNCFGYRYENTIFV